MGRMGIDYPSVREAAEALRAEGEPVTVERVRAALGSGSFTTLGRHLRAWRRTQAPAEPSDLSLPEQIHDAAQTVWANLSRAADQRVEEARAAAQSAVLAMQEQMADALAEAQTQQTQLKRDHARDARHLEERLREAQERCEHVEAQLRESEQARQQADVKAGQGEAHALQLTERLQDSHVQLQQAHKAHQTAQGRIQELEDDRRATAEQQQTMREALLQAHAQEQAQWQTQRQLFANQAEDHRHVIKQLQQQKDVGQAALEQLTALSAQQQILHTTLQALGGHQQTLVEKLADQMHRAQTATLAQLREATSQHQLEMLQLARDHFTEGLQGVQQAVTQQLKKHLSEINRQKA